MQDCPESPNLLDDNAVYPRQWPQANRTRNPLIDHYLPVRIYFDSSIPVPNSTVSTPAFKSPPRIPSKRILTTPNQSGSNKRVDLSPAKEFNGILDDILVEDVEMNYVMKNHYLLMMKKKKLSICGVILRKMI